MRKMDSDGLTMCRMQGKIFEKSLKKVNLGSPLFVRKYMNSNDARSMDICVYLDLCRFDDQILEDLNGDKPYGRTFYDEEVLYWMGYIYRYWAYVYEISSKKLYKIFPGNKLAELYYVYHTFDPMYAIDRIIETFNLNMEDDRNTKCASLVEEKTKEFKLELK